MSSSRHPIPTLAWISLAQVDAVRAIAAGAGLRITLAGSGEAGRSGEVARALGDDVGIVDDLRAGMMAIEPGGSGGLVLLASPGDFGAGAEHEDFEVLSALKSRGVRVVSFEPIPSSLLHLPPETGLVEGERDHRRSGMDWAAFAPLMRAGATWRGAEELMEAFGPPMSVHVTSIGRRDHGTLGARVLDAMESLIWLMGLPERIYATYIYPGVQRGLVVLPGEDLRGLSGDMVAATRFPDGRGATLHASDRGGRWARSMAIVGTKGRIRIEEDGFEWIDETGATVDSSRVRTGATGDGFVDQVIEQLQRVLDPALPRTPPIDPAKPLAACSAALLSARTGEAESPGTMLRMMGHDAPN